MKEFTSEINYVVIELERDLQRISDLQTKIEKKFGMLSRTQINTKDAQAVLHTFRYIDEYVLKNKLQMIGAITELKRATFYKDLPKSRL